MELVIYKIDGSKTSRKVNLDDTVFGIEPNDHAIYLDVKQHQANKRQGTHDSLEKSTISGTTKKLKRQKGTGGARAGSMKSPLFSGGARVFGPHPRDYSFKLNRKLKVLARKSALSYKAKENNIIVLEDFKFEEIATRQYQNLLNNLKVADKRTLMVTSEPDQKLVLSSRNIQKTKVITACSLNTYDILNAANLIILESSVKDIEKIHSSTQTI